MADDEARSAEQRAAIARFERLIDKRAEKLAKEIKGHIVHITPRELSLPMQLLGREFEKSARRKLN